MNLDLDTHDESLVSQRVLGRLMNQGFKDTFPHGAGMDSLSDINDRVFAEKFVLPGYTHENVCMQTPFMKQMTTRTADSECREMEDTVFMDVTYSFVRTNRNGDKYYLFNSWGLNSTTGKGMPLFAGA